MLQQHGTLYQAAARLPRVAELRGRGVTLVAQIGADPWVVRHYHRGGAVMHLLKDRYLRLGRPRALAELAASEAARSRGIATPAVKAAAWYRSGVFCRYDIATEYLPASADLAQLIFDERTRAAAVRAAAALIKSMLQGGLLHQDLNLKNILISAGSAHVVDLDRCVVVPQVSALHASAMRNRFFRSLAKWEQQTRSEIPPAAREKLRDAFRV